MDKSVRHFTSAVFRVFVVVAQSCARRGIASPITPDLIVHLRSDNKGALLVQCPSDANNWLDELVRYRHSEFGRIGYAGAIASLVEQGIPLEEAASEFGCRGRACRYDSILGGTGHPVGRGSIRIWLLRACR